MTRLFLGVDGGQSSTTAVIGDETGRVVGTGRGGPCHDVRAALRDSVHTALPDAGGSEASFEAACLGFSGGFADKEAVSRELVNARQYLFMHDAQIALAGATGGGPGVITIAGTGSIAFGRNAEGRVARAGGWGYAFGDEGGAFDLVRQALRAALRYEEGWGPRTALLPLLTEAARAKDANDLMHRFYAGEYSRGQFASFAYLVEDAERAGDGVARDILHGAAQALATFTAAVRGQLFRPSEIVRICYSGGVFRSGIILERYRMLVELDEGNRVAPPMYGPAAGALIEAYRMAGVNCSLRNVPAEKAGGVPL